MFEFIYDYFSKEDVVKYIRLTIVVAMYLFFRKYYSTWAQKKQQERQLAIDAEEKAAKPEKERKEQEALEEKISRDAKTFGWGKKTRSREKKKQAIVEQIAEEERARYQTAYDAAADHDIEHLLEDWWMRWDGQ